MKITLVLDSVEEANGILLALGKFPLDQVVQLYAKLQAQIKAQTDAAPPAPPAPAPAADRKPRRK